MDGEIVFHNHIAYIKRTDKEKGEDGEYHEVLEWQEIDSLIPYLQLPVKLEEGTLFDDIWFYIEKDASLFNLIFASSLGYHKLEPFIEQFKKPSRPREDEDPNDSMHSLVASWEVEAETFEGEDSLAIAAGFSGYGRMIENGKSEEVSYALDFTPVNDLKGYELKVDDYVVIKKINLDDISQNHPDDPSLFEGQMDFTVYNLIDAILYEITFMGYPDDKIQEFAKFDQIVAEVKDQLNFGDRNGLTSLEDLREKIDDEDDTDDN